MSAKKLETALSLIEVLENNLKTVKNMLKQMVDERGVRMESHPTKTTMKNVEEGNALEVVEGYFDGENMIDDNTQIYPVPQNYASKTQLVIGDRMKWILTPEREIFKLIHPTSRKRISGNFNIEGENYVVLCDEYPNPIKILKASATYAIKNLGLKIGDIVTLYIPENSTPVWGAFISVVKGNLAEIDESQKPKIQAELSDLDDLNEFSFDAPKPSKISDDISQKVEDFF
jgi:hypothetical protein